MDILDAKKLLAEQISSETNSISGRNIQSSNNGNHQSPNNVQKDNFSNLQFNTSELPSKYDLNLSLNFEDVNGIVGHKDQTESQQENETNFKDDNSRKKFIKKVYIVLLMHFIALFGIVSIFAICPPIIVRTGMNDILIPIGFCMLLVVLFILAFNEKFCRTFPRNILIFCVFTKAESLIFGYISAKSHTMIIIIAIALMIGICLALIIQNKYGFTIYKSSILILFVILIEIVFLNILILPTTLELVLSSLGTLIFSFHMIFDIQLMVNEKHEYSINSEEYVFAAFIFNIDIINIPLHILRIIRGINKKLTI